MEAPQGFVEVTGIGAVAPGRNADAEWPKQISLALERCISHLAALLYYHPHYFCYYYFSITEHNKYLEKGPYRKSELL